MKDIHPELTNAKYKCASCNSEFNILSSKGGEIAIDVCSNCHPFYIGKTSSSSLRGKAEKLASKFDAGKANMNKKEEKPVKIKKEKKQVNTNFENL